MLTQEHIEDIKTHKFYQYAYEIVNNSSSNNYIYKQCKKTLDDFERFFSDPNYEFEFSYDSFKKVRGITELLIMPTGVNAGKTVRESLLPFQWYLIINYLCWYCKADNSRRFTRADLFIPRKNAKTFIVAVVNIILVLISNKYSEFYSVAPDRKLSGIVKTQMEQILNTSPKISRHFKYTRDKLICNINQSFFEPLANGQDSFDGRLATGWIADEVGALRNAKPIEAMKSSQVQLADQTGMIISTAYDNTYNPMIAVVKYAKSVLDGIVENERHFAVIYELEKPEDWLDINKVLECNPLALAIDNFKENLNELLERAKMDKSSEANFRTKHCNTFMSRSGTDGFIQDIDTLLDNSVESIDWDGKRVNIGVDLSHSDDNCSVSMLCYEPRTTKFYCKSWVFYPLGKEESKTAKEKVDYKHMRELGYAYGVGDKIVDYNFIEEFIMELENRYGVNIDNICFDPWNAAASISRLANAGYSAVVIGQGVVQHPFTKRLKETIESGNFIYEENKLLELNFTNAVLKRGVDGRMQVIKLQNSDKIDIVDSIINAIAPFEEEITDDRDDYSPIHII